ncbi:MAG: molybdenum cofactor guanylyltransferase [Clostridia bacterium]|jgi:molybdopterin-guanine dinucleotide biosynthesis protein A|nr:molybdenum cofactor guanylyltransferase [Clostridia bacterium]
MKFSAVILAGGKSSRMKMNKALLPAGDKSFIETIAGELAKHFNEVIIITNTLQTYEFLPYKKYPDIIKDKGPLGGIHSGLNHASNEYSFVTACDMPFIDGAAALRLCNMADGYHGVVPKKGEYLQPLFAVYSKRCIPYIEKCLAQEQYRIISFYPYVQILFPDWDQLLGHENAAKTFFNINTPEDLKIYRKYEEN